MFQGSRTITQIVTTNTLTLGGSPNPIHITYDDGSQESVVPYIQGVYQNIQTGMVEEFDQNGNRIGWTWPNMSAPRWQVFPQLPISPMGPMPSFPSIQSTLEDFMTRNKTDVGQLLKRLGVDVGDTGVNYLPATCSRCKTENSHIVFSYHAFGIKRVICNVCATEVMDKFFGVSNNAKAEKILYDKKE